MSDDTVVIYKSPAFTLLLAAYVLVPNAFFVYEIIAGVPKDSLQIITENCMAAFYLFFLYSKHERIVLFTRAISIIFGLGYLLVFLGMVNYNALPMARDLSESGRIAVIIVLSILIFLSVYIFLRVKHFIIRVQG